MHFLIFLSLFVAVIMSDSTYDNLPNSLPSNVVSIGYEANSITQLGAGGVGILRIDYGWSPYTIFINIDSDSCPDIPCATKRNIPPKSMSEKTEEEFL